MAASVASAYNTAASHGYQSSVTSESSTAKASSSRSSQRAEQHDRFYGYREPAELCERFILYLFSCPLDSTSASASLPHTSSGTPAPRLSEFIAYALYRTRLPEAVTFQALYLLLRLKIRFPAARGSSGHRLFISALMIASKSSCDDTYSNKSWAIVGQGLFSLREINQMERELFGYLGYKVNVVPEDLEMFTYELEQDVDGGRIDLVVRKILEIMSRRSGEEGGRERSESVSSVKSSAPPTPALESEGFSSPSVDSHSGHRGTFPQRASYSASSVGMPTSTPMVKSASHRQERSATAPSFIHPFSNATRRPNTTPANNLPLSTSGAYYAHSPTASIASSSSMSYTASTVSATPSPFNDQRSMSGRTTPDTPPSDVDEWGDARFYVEDKIGSTYRLPQSQKVAGQQEAFLHPYHCWRA